jgi:hypothetical protein
LGTNLPINLKELNMDMINHSDINGGFFDDNLCITGKENSDKLFKSIFDDVVMVGKESGLLNSAESSWTSMMDTYKLKHLAIKNHTLNFELLRENKVWWGDENGNIIE